MAIIADKERQIKNSFIYLVPVIFGNLIPLVTLPVFTRILTKEDYGAWALSQVYAIVLVALTNFGLMASYERNFFESVDLKKTSGLLYSTLLFVLAGFLVCILLTYQFRFFLSKAIIGSSNHATLLFWTFCATGLMRLKTYYITYFKNTENAKSLVWYTIDESILGVVLTFIFIVYLRVGVIGLAWGQLLASIVIFSLLSFKFVKLLPISFNWGLLKDSLKLGYPLAPKILLGMVGNQFDKYMIGLLSSIGGVGIYSIGQKIANIVFTYMSAIQNVWSPQVYKKMFELGKKGGEAIGRYLTPFVYISISIGLLISIFSEEAISILTPKSFHGAIDIVTIFCLTYGIMFFEKQPQLIFRKKTYMITLLNMIGIILTVVICIPLIKKWGAIGAAWGSLLATLICLVIDLNVYQHFYKIKWEYKKIGTILLIFFISSMLTILLRGLMVNYSIRLTLKLIFIICYIYLGIKIKIITLENLKIIKNLIWFKNFALFHRN
jgi:O-antigen/teichoic acid export membrane protein